MNPSAMGNFGSPIVATERGVGFLDRARGELRLPFGVHVSPALLFIRPATAEEAREFFETRMAVKRTMTAYYDRKTFTGD